MKRSCLWIAIAILLAASIQGCGKPRPPLEELRSALQGVPTYSIILDDMKEEGNFSKSYYHKYKILMEEKTTGTDWMPVSKDVYQKYLPFLGMTVWVKKDGKEAGSIGPPGYEYVGDPRYGRWNTDSSGHSFWVFYGQYRLLSDLLGGGLIYRDSWDRYRTYRSRNQPYYGPNREYGTNGTITKQQKPNFYARRMAAERAKKTSFSKRVGSRIGRTRTGYRARGFGMGK